MRFTWTRPVVASAALVLASIVGAGTAQAAQPAPARPFSGSVAVAPGLVLPVAAVGRPLPGDPNDVVPPRSAESTQPDPATTRKADPFTETKPAPKPSLVGYDVSWPQCGDTLPTDPAFVIVGVTGGLANNTNTCLAEQLAWAETSTGVTAQPRVALYVNTANPGRLGSWWPTSDSYAGAAVTNPYGTCAGDEDAACSYVYGWAKAYDDAMTRGVASPESYLWWLDVEWENTWAADEVANRAVLEGMTAYFESIGAEVGLYSTGRQWGAIVGSVPAGSNLYDLPSWLAGAHTLAGAKSNCALAPLTGGGTVTMTQYLTKNLDHNHSCR
jgi:hypothetical protein